MLPRRRIIDSGGALPAGCVLQLDATSLALADAAAVASWPARVGAFTPAQATGTQQPTFVIDASNGRGAVRFDGVDDVLSCPSSAPLRPADYWAIVAAVKLPSSFAGTPFLYVCDIANFATTGAYITSVGKLALEERNNVGGQDLVASGMTGLVTGTRALIEIHWTGGQVEYWVNGVRVDTQVASGTTLKTDGAATVQIGAYNTAGGQSWPGDIYELRIYAQAGQMNVAQHARLQKTLNAKWGLY